MKKVVERMYSEPCGPFEGGICNVRLIFFLLGLPLGRSPTGAPTLTLGAWDIL